MLNFCSRLWLEYRSDHWSNWQTCQYSFTKLILIFLCQWSNIGHFIGFSPPSAESSFLRTQSTLILKNALSLFGRLPSRAGQMVTWCGIWRHSDQARQASHVFGWSSGYVCYALERIPYQTQILINQYRYMCGVWRIYLEICDHIFSWFYLRILRW